MTQVLRKQEKDNKWGIESQMNMIGKEKMELFVRFKTHKTAINQAKTVKNQNQ